MIEMELSDMREKILLLEEGRCCTAPETVRYPQILTTACRYCGSYARRGALQRWHNESAVVHYSHTWRKCGNCGKWSEGRCENAVSPLFKENRTETDRCDLWRG